MSQPVLLVSDERMLLHHAGLGHPERPERLRAVLHALQPRRIDNSTPASRAAIERIHANHYVNLIESHRGRAAQLEEDTAVSAGSVDAAYLAAGAAIHAVESVVRGEVKRAFALVRPPGHHAEREQAMGFCLFNNIAIAAAHAIAELNCRRVLIVDWDVHHGNGTQHAFEARRDVLVFDVHQHRLYPNSGDLDEVGIGDGTGFTVNAPLPAGMDDHAYCELFQRVMAPVADAYKPDLVLVSAGFDAHRSDPLGGMKLTEDGYAQLCGIVREIADRHADGRCILILEGGYDLDALAGSVVRCIEVLEGATPLKSDSSKGSSPLIEAIRRFHAAHWPCLNAITSRATGSQ